MATTIELKTLIAKYDITHFDREQHRPWMDCCTPSPTLLNSGIDDHDRLYLNIPFFVVSASITVKRHMDRKLITHCGGLLIKQTNAGQDNHFSCKSTAGLLGACAPLGQTRNDFAIVEQLLAGETVGLFEYRWHPTKGDYLKRYDRWIKLRLNQPERQRLLRDQQSLALLNDILQEIRERA